MVHTPEETSIIIKICQIPKHKWKHKDDGYYVTTQTYEYLFEGIGSSFPKLSIRPKGSSDSSKGVEIAMNQALKDYAFDVYRHHKDQEKTERSKVLQHIEHELNDLVEFSK